MPLLLLTIVLLRAQRVAPRPARLHRARRQDAASRGWSSSGACKWPALAFAFFVLSLPLFLPYAALINSAFSRVASRLISFETADAAQLPLHVLRVLARPCRRCWNTFILGTRVGHDRGTRWRWSSPTSSPRRAVRGHRVLGFLATAPIAIPGIVLGVGLFLAYTRRRPLGMLYGTLWILLIAYPHHRAAAGLPADAARPSTPCIPSSRRRAASWARRGCARSRDITAPLLRTSVVATWCFVFVGRDPRAVGGRDPVHLGNTKVLSVLIFDLNESGDLGAIAVLSLTMVAVTTAVIALANRLGTGRAPARIAG